MSSIEQDIVLVEASGLLHAQWYLAQYADAAKSNHGATEHYLKAGAKLLYDPSPGFSTRRYLRANPDVAAAGMNPLLHYLRFGQKEGRVCFPVGGYTADDTPPVAMARDPDDIHRDVQIIRKTRLFDPDYYLRIYPDIGASGTDPLLHYVEYGAREGRLPNAYFDTRFYQAAYQTPDDHSNPLAHYATTSGSEACRTSRQFDGRFYSARYPDTHTSGLKPLEHFLVQGVLEGRQTVFPTLAQTAVPRIIDCRRIRTTVIVPVHDARNETIDCLHSLLRHTELGDADSLLVIDDASTDPGVREVLDGLAGLPGIMVVRNPSNLGYTRTVNKGCDLAGDEDVVLLNSDTVVGPHWLRNLKVAAYHNDRIGTVTAVSDNAGAFSVPNPGHNEIPDGIDTNMLARAVMDSGEVAPIEVPTGNGFCLYIKREVIKTIGRFDDAAFPQGYGEENDFCMRALAAGWYNVVDPRTWVHHVRSASFRERRQALVEVGAERVQRLHPHYTGAINTIGSSPSLAAARYRIDRQFRELAAGKRKPLPRILFVISTRIGGVPQANRDLMRAIADVYDCYALYCDRNTIQVLRVSETDYEVVESYPLANPLTFATHASREYDDIARSILVRRGIDLLHIRHLAWHSLNLVDAANSLGIPVICSFHDYYSVCPTVNLIDRQGRYHPHGVAEDAENALWPGDPSVMPVTADLLGYWQRRMQQALSTVDAFVVSSHSAGRLLADALPDLAARAEDFHIIPHGRDFERFELCADPGDVGADEPLRILLPGNIGVHKGGGLIARIKQLDASDLLQFHLIGTGSSDLKACVIDHGPYQRAQFAELAGAIRPHVAVVLSIVPETWCHTLTESWAAGVPVLGIDRGAVGDRIREHGGGWLVDGDADPAEIHARLMSLRDMRHERRARIDDIQRWQEGEGRSRTTAHMSGHYLTLYRSVIQRHRLLDQSTCRRTALALAGCFPAASNARYRSILNRKAWLEHEYGQPVDTVDWSVLLRAEAAIYSVVAVEVGAVPSARREAVMAALQSAPGRKTLELPNETMPAGACDAPLTRQ